MMLIAHVVQLVNIVRDVYAASMAFSTAAGFLIGNMIEFQKLGFGVQLPIGDHINRLCMNLPKPWPHLAVSSAPTRNIGWKYVPGCPVHPVYCTVTVLLPGMAPYAMTPVAAAVAAVATPSAPRVPHQ